MSAHILHKLAGQALLVLTLIVIAVSNVRAQTISGAKYLQPVERYGHFALGRPHEYAQLSVTLSNGQTRTLDLPADEVFEDREPRLVKLGAGEAAQILAIVSQRHSGSRLVLIKLDNDALSMAAQSQAIGTANRWLNPVGVADLDSDGQAEIAAVITPHIGGNLKVYKVQGADLVEIAALAGFSNHIYHSEDLALSTPMAIAGTMHLLVPDMSRRQLRIIALSNGQLRQVGVCELPSPIRGGLKTESEQVLSVQLNSGQVHLVPHECL